MKFSNFRKNKRLMKNYRVIIYYESKGDKLYDDILPVGYSENGSKMYNGLLTKQDRDYYDNVFRVYGDFVIIDKDIDDENKIIYLYISEGGS